MKFPIRSIKSYDLREGREVETIQVIVGDTMRSFRSLDGRESLLQMAREFIKGHGCEVPAFKFFEAEDWPGAKITMETIEVEP